MQTNRPDRLYWHVRLTVAAALRLVDGHCLDVLQADLGEYRSNLTRPDDQRIPQRENLREACAHAWDRLLEMQRRDSSSHWGSPLDILGYIEEEYGRCPDPDRMILPPPGSES